MSPISQLLTDTVSPSALEFLADVVVRGAIVLLLCAAVLVTPLLRHAAAATRHLVWCFGMLCLALLPLAGMLVPSWRILPADIGATNAVLAERPDDPGDDALVNFEVRGTSAINAVSTPSPIRSETPRVGWGTWMLIAWLAVTLLLVSRLGVALLGLRRLERRSVRERDSRAARLLETLARGCGLRRPVVLLLSRDRETPMTWGILRPVVLLPAAAAEWPEHRLRAVFLHELGHVRRLDCLTRCAAWVVSACYWFNPMVWVARHAMLGEQERACDDLVLTSGGGGTSASAYAEELVRIAAALPLRTSMANLAGIGMAARPSDLERRVRAILDPHARRGSGTSRGRLVAAAVIASVVVVPLSALRAADPPAPAPPPASTPSSRPATRPATAETNALEARLRDAEQALRRTDTLRKQAAATEEEYEQAKLDVEIAAAELKGDQTEVARLNLRGAELRLARVAKLREHNSSSLAEYEEAKIAVEIAAARLKNDATEVLRLKLKRAELELVRVDRMRAAKAVSESEYEDAKITVAMARAELNGDTAEIGRLKLQRAELKLQRIVQLRQQQAASTAEFERAKLARDRAAAELKGDAVEAARIKREQEKASERPGEKP